MRSIAIGWLDNFSSLINAFRWKFIWITSLDTMKYDMVMHVIGDLITIEIQSTTNSRYTRKHTNGWKSTSTEIKLQYQSTALSCFIKFHCAWKTLSSSFSLFVHLRCSLVRKPKKDREPNERNHNAYHFYAFFAYRLTGDSSRQMY